jgi:hypothetical protein
MKTEMIETLTNEQLEIIHEDSARKALELLEIARIAREELESRGETTNPLN